MLRSIHIKEIAENFYESFSQQISKEKPPVIYNLIDVDLIDVASEVASKSRSYAKKEYMRVRSFVFFDNLLVSIRREKN